MYMEWVKRVDKKHLPTLSNLYGFLDEMALISERSESRLLDRKKSDVPTSSTLTCQFASQANYAAEEQEESDMPAMLNGEDPGCDGDPHPETCVEFSTTACTQFEGNMKQQVLLSTAVVSVEDGNGVDKPVRVLLDSGSQSNFITTECVKRLNLSIIPVEPIKVNGIGGSNRFTVDSICNLTMKSRFGKFVIPMAAIVVPKVTNKLPAVSFEKSN
ncbi:hypothetical protein WDU94_012410 [Cyamophila willieti]